MKICKKYFFLLGVFVLAIACKKENEESPKIELDEISIPMTAWICESLDAHLMGIGTDLLDKEVNEQLNEYTPKLGLIFSGNKCMFISNNDYSNVMQEKRWFDYSPKDGKSITFTHSPTSDFKLVTTGYIQGNKLYLKFMNIDFKTLTTVLDNDYPYYPSMLEHIKGGYVNLVFTSTRF